MPPEQDVGVHELARQVRDVLTRFQLLAERLDNTYTTKEMFSLYKTLVDQSLTTLQDKLNTLEKDKLETSVGTDIARRLTKIEENQTWLVRLLVSLIIVAVVGTVLVTGGAK
jgi:hypothetical protein